MQNAETVLSILKQKSEHDENYKFNRLYRNLFNEDFYLQAYQTIYAKEGNMTKGVDQNTIDGFNRKQIKQLIDHLKSECYQPLPVKRVYIPKKNNKKKRPLGIPVFSDKLIQEVIRELLEVIYEPLFCNTSHGYRPNRSCHTALYQTKQTFIGANWIIEGDITGFFDNVDHETLLKLLAKKICDGRLLELIRRFLKAGYFEFKQVHNSLSGTPQGSNLSPILANSARYHLAPELPSNWAEAPKNASGTTPYPKSKDVRNKRMVHESREYPRLPMSTALQLIDRMLRNVCELCGAEVCSVEMHHICKLKNLSRNGRRHKPLWMKTMIALRRKTLAVCRECHVAIHAGKYDGVCVH